MYIRTPAIACRGFNRKVFLGTNSSLSESRFFSHVPVLGFHPFPSTFSFQNVVNVSLVRAPVLRCHHVQFRQTENSWRLGRSHRRGNCCNITCLVDAASLCAVVPPAMRVITKSGVG